MIIEKGLLDEVMGVFIGVSFTLTFFNTSLSVPARIGPLIFGIVLVPGLLVGMKFKRGASRLASHLVWIVASIALARVMIYSLSADTVASFSLPVGIASWAISRELIGVMERSE